MVIEVVVICAEMLANLLIVNCAIGFLGKKGLTCLTWLYIVLATGFLELINIYAIDARWSIMVHCFTFIYCMIRVGKINRALFATACGIIILTVLEMLITIPIILVKKQIIFDNMHLSLIINLVIIPMIYYIIWYKRLDKELNKFYEIIENERYVLILILSTFLIFSYEVKTKNIFRYYTFFRFFLYFITIIGISLLWRRESIKNIKQKFENEQMGLYSQTYDTVLKNMHARQHEFNNHLNNIINMHVIYKDYDSLVNNQMEYVGNLKESYKFQKLLDTKQPILSGFLYMEFVRYEEIEADISYNIEVNDVSSFIPIVELVEVLATFIDNAFQALEGLSGQISKKFSMEILEGDDVLEIYVANTLSEEIKYNKLIHFFDRGYSTKGSGHGTGLFNAKNIIKRYSGDISIRCTQEENECWITIKCKLKRRQKQ